MSHKNTIRCGVLTLLAAVFCFGCSAHKIEEVEYSGFLKDYQGMTHGSDDQAVMVYRDAQVDMKPYNKIMIDRVKLVLDPKSKGKELDPDELKAAADYFNQALIRELKSGYQLVEQAGPNVMHLRTAITDVVPGNPVSGTTASILPIGMVVAGAKGAATGSGVGVGQAAAEVEILDSVTGQRLAAAVDRRAGGQAPFKGKMTDAEDAMDYWAKRIRQRLDQERGVR